MLFMVVEGFKDGDAAPVYERYRDKGRQLPEGVRYIDSWVSADLTMCFQVMEAPDRARLAEWIDRWSDLVEFEVVRPFANAPTVSNASDAFRTRGTTLPWRDRNRASCRCPVIRRRTSDP